MKRIIFLLATINVYFISALGAIEKHGAIYGSWFSLKRICRCHPFSQSGGYDPLP